MIYFLRKWKYSQSSYILLIIIYIWIKILCKKKFTYNNVCAHKKVIEHRRKTASFLPRKVIFSIVRNLYTF